MDVLGNTLFCSEVILFFLYADLHHTYPKDLKCYIWRCLIIRDFPHCTWTSLRNKDCMATNIYISYMIRDPSWFMVHQWFISDASWHSKDFLGSNNSRCEHSSGIQVRGLSFGAPNALLPPSQKRKRKLHTKSKQKNAECEPHESETNNKMPRCLVKLFSWKFRHPRMNKNTVIKHVQKNNWYDFNHLQSPQSSPTLAALIVLEARISCAGFSLTPLGAHFLPKACGKSWLQNASNHMAICWGS